jgi:hypothetical protein
MMAVVGVFFWYRRGRSARPDATSDWTPPDEGEKEASCVLETSSSSGT